MFFILKYAIAVFIDELSNMKDDLHFLLHGDALKKILLSDDLRTDTDNSKK